MSKLPCPNPRPDASLRFKGFTLVEALVVTAIVATLLGLSIPPFISALRSLELRACTLGFMQALLVARSEAIKRNSRVVLCKSASGVQCTTQGDWGQGWMVFHDRNNDGIRQAEEALILVRTNNNAAIHGMGNQNVSSYVSFTGQGTTHLLTHAFQAGSIRICMANHPEVGTRKVTINAVGRFRAEVSEPVHCH